MGEFLIAPIIILAVAGLIWFVFFSGSVIREKRAMESLPDDPYERREAELGRMRAEHDATRAEDVTHPARRP